MMPRLPQRRPGGTSAGRRVPWSAVWAAAVWLYQQGHDRYERNLTGAEQAELRQLLLKSRGRAGSLTAEQRRRVGELVRKIATGSE